LEKEAAQSSNHFCQPLEISVIFLWAVPVIVGLQPLAVTPRRIVA
jgi:hypothetical protein